MRSVVQTQKIGPTSQNANDQKKSELEKFLVFVHKMCVLYCTPSFCSLVSRIQNFQTSLNEKGVCGYVRNTIFELFAKTGSERQSSKSFSIVLAGLKGNHYISD